MYNLNMILFRLTLNFHEVCLAGNLTPPFNPQQIPKHYVTKQNIRLNAKYEDLFFSPRESTFTKCFGGQEFYVSFYLSFLHVTRNANTIIDTIWSSIGDVFKTDNVCVFRRIISIQTCCILWHTISIRGSTLHSIQLFSLGISSFYN